MRGSGPYTYTTVAAGTGDEAGLAGATGLRLMGVSIRESAAGAATVNIEHGTANSSPVMWGATLVASTGKEWWFGPQGLPCDDGIWIERVAGNTAVFLITCVD
jgi:hypothetical protein